MLGFSIGVEEDKKEKNKEIFEQVIKLNNKFDIVDNEREKTNLFLILSILMENIEEEQFLNNFYHLFIQLFSNIQLVEKNQFYFYLFIASSFFITSLLNKSKKNKIKNKKNQKMIKNMIYLLTNGKIEIKEESEEELEVQEQTEKEKEEEREEQLELQKITQENRMKLKNNTNKIGKIIGITLLISSLSSPVQLAQFLEIYEKKYEKNQEKEKEGKIDSEIKKTKKNFEDLSYFLLVSKLFENHLISAAKISKVLEKIHEKMEIIKQSEKKEEEMERNWGMVIGYSQLLQLLNLFLFPLSENLILNFIEFLLQFIQLSSNITEETRKYLLFGLLQLFGGNLIYFIDLKLNMNSNFHRKNSNYFSEFLEFLLPGLNSEKFNFQNLSVKNQLFNYLLENSYKIDFSIFSGWVIGILSRKIRTNFQYSSKNKQLENLAKNSLEKYLYTNFFNFVESKVYFTNENRLNLTKILKLFTQIPRKKLLNIQWNIFLKKLILSFSTGELNEENENTENEKDSLALLQFYSIKFIFYFIENKSLVDLLNYLLDFSNYSHFHWKIQLYLLNSFDIYFIHFSSTRFSEILFEFSNFMEKKLNFLTNQEPAKKLEKSHYLFIEFWIDSLRKTFLQFNSQFQTSGGTSTGAEAIQNHQIFQSIVHLFSLLPSPIVYSGNSPSNSQESNAASGELIEGENDPAAQLPFNYFIDLNYLFYFFKYSKIISEFSLDDISLYFPVSLNDYSSQTIHRFILHIFLILDNKISVKDLLFIRSWLFTFPDPEYSSIFMILLFLPILKLTFPNATSQSNSNLSLSSSTSSAALSGYSSSLSLLYTWFKDCLDIFASSKANFITILRCFSWICYFISTPSAPDLLFPDFSHIFNSARSVDDLFKENSKENENSFYSTACKWSYLSLSIEQLLSSHLPSALRRLTRELNEDITTSTLYSIASILSHLKSLYEHDESAFYVHQVLKQAALPIQRRIA